MLYSPQFTKKKVNLPLLCIPKLSIQTHP